MYIGMPFLQKLMFPSRLNKYSLDLIFLLTNHKPKQTPQIFLEQSCVVRKKRQSDMSKTKLQAKMINKFVVFWETHMS